MKISLAVTVCNELEEIQKLLPFLIDNKRKEDEIVIDDLSLKINELEVVEPVYVNSIDQVSLDFDMPLNNDKSDFSNKIIHELIEDVNEIEVNDPVHIIPVTEINVSGSNKSGVDDYEKSHIDFTESSVKSLENEKERNFNPMNSSISEGLSRRTEERKVKLKEYNYNFSKANSVNSMENEPAFKRAGISLDDIESVKASRTSVSEDSNGEINLRTNNSFLHDNVD